MNIKRREQLNHASKINGITSCQRYNASIANTNIFEGSFYKSNHGNDSLCFRKGSRSRSGNMKAIIGLPILLRK